MTEEGPAPRKTGRAGTSPARRPSTPGKPTADGIEFDDPSQCRCEICEGGCPCDTEHASAVCACCRAGYHDGTCHPGDREPVPAL